ncbi:eukaryotic translation initiation factor 4G1, eIF4E-binding domain-containing protein [Lactarius indigo]|nr:eukaryotic translation initiation factor 4G1, eIF4E-binding domain-containing protein [Lactarius indigo]
MTSNKPPTLPSALATARPIEDLDRISYPEGIKNPMAELNVNAQKGKFRYDRDFLLQFMNICKEKPDNLPLFDMIGKRPGPRNLQTTTTGGSAPTLSSALGTARHIEDVNRIPYPEGIKNTNVHLDVNTQEGKSRYVPSIFDFAFNPNTFPCCTKCGYCLGCSN